jgi:hypothetical protein
MGTKNVSYIHRLFLCFTPPTDGTFSFYKNTRFLEALRKYVVYELVYSLPTTLPAGDQVSYGNN